jgi:hypothetical protein
VVSAVEEGLLEVADRAVLEALEGMGITLALGLVVVVANPQRPTRVPAGAPEVQGALDRLVRGRVV